MTTRRGGFLTRPPGKGRVGLRIGFRTSVEQKALLADISGKMLVWVQIIY